MAEPRGPAWPEIPGITIDGDDPRLPRRPMVVVAGIRAAIQERTLAREAWIRLVGDRTGEERPRLEHLADWLGRSRMARWDDGHLALHPAVTSEDLCLRYAAWVHTRRTEEGHLDDLHLYAAAVISEAGDDLPRGRPRPQVAKAWVRAGARPLPTPPEDPPLVPSELTAKIRRLLAHLDGAFAERRPQTRLALLALLAGQHTLLLGPPGTAKSMLARALCACFDGAGYFEYLLSKFTTPDEIFGPVSIPGLKEEDYRRLTEGFLPTAHVAFLDEVFKANSSILNSLLTVVNERVFHHGRRRDTVPLLGLVGASNELPDAEGSLAALYDRFLVRLTVPPLATADSFLSVVTHRLPAIDIPAEDRLTTQDLDILRAAAHQVAVPDDVAHSLVVLWEQAARADWRVSDRRWSQAVHMLQVAVAAAGRTAVVPLDLVLLEPVLLPEPGRLAEVRSTLLDHLGPSGVPDHDLRAQWGLVRIDRVAPTPDDPWPATAGEGTPWTDRLAVRRQNVDRLLTLHGDVTAELAAARRVVEAIGDAHPWLPGIPVELLAPHLRAARTLADSLALAEGYRRDISDLDGVIAAMLKTLPSIEDADWLPVAEREEDPELVLALEPEGVVAVGHEGSGWVLLSPRFRKTPSLMVSTGRFMDWLAGTLQTEELVTSIERYEQATAALLLEGLRLTLAEQIVPDPPEVTLET